MCERVLRIDSPRSYLARGLSKKAFAGHSPPTHDNNTLHGISCPREERALHGTLVPRGGNTLPGKGGPREEDTFHRNLGPREEDTLQCN